MGIVLLLILAAIAWVVIVFVAKLVKWLLIIAAVFLVIGAVRMFADRRT